MSQHGGVFLDLRDAGFTGPSQSGSSTLFRDMWKITDQWLRSRGLDYHHQPLEIACFAHAINGGLRIDERAQSTIQGLLAAGETAGGPHGADRLGGNMLVTCMVFGAIAGLNAADVARVSPVDHPPRLMISDAESFVQSRLGNSGEHSIDSLITELQHCMWQNVLVVRSEKKLLDCLEVIQGIRDSMDAGLKQDNSLFGRLELENMLLVSEVMVKAALARTESRGSHYREDYPENGGDSWRRPITMRTDGELQGS